eukprot:gb/GECH01004725.1/.p1 GENE.gb/GECH01004725.1/~~gb/GECH01004725.1/.p1  ORF type:complete len:200 (+),score=37.56 gb/GECH01004725.1/:1-600(+)
MFRHSSATTRTTHLLSSSRKTSSNLSKPLFNNAFQSHLTSRSFSTFNTHKASLSTISSHITSSKMNFGKLYGNNRRFYSDDNTVNVTFITPEGERVPINAEKGDSILEVAHKNDVFLEGACEGSLACSTCHVILPEKYFEKLEEPCEEEEDMLDLAFGLTETSRLGCQVIISDELENMEITLPDATRNMAVDGHKPAPH